MNPLPDTSAEPESDVSLRSSPAASERRDLLFAAGAALLIATAVVVPLVRSQQWRGSLVAEAAPIFGFWDAHLGWGTPLAVVVAAAVIGFGGAVSTQLAWRPLLLVSWLVSMCWAFSLAMVDGWHRGFVDRLLDPNEYLYEVGGVHDIGQTLRGFSDRVLEFQPDSWTTHVSGHPPGALLTFVALDRIGLGGGAWAAVLCMAVGCGAAVAVAVATAALTDEQTARRALPFLVLAPAAVWIAVSADAYFAGVTAWGVALLALAATRSVRQPTLVAFAAGLLLGFGIYLSYGLVLMGLPTVAVLVATRNYRPLLPALLGAGAVALAFTTSGFWWFDGYHLVVERYYQGIAAARPFSYWGWANLASLTCSVGITMVAALHRVLRPASLRSRDGLSLLVFAALAAVIAADLSALSKAETERIWLPFAVWLLAAPALLPPQRRSMWLMAQVVLTLGISHFTLTNW